MQRINSISPKTCGDAVSLLSIVIPAHNEEGHIVSTVKSLVKVLNHYEKKYEIIIVDDHSLDSTLEVCNDMVKSFPSVCIFQNPHARGFGLAVRYGLAQATGDAVAIVMADASDDPTDLIKYCHMIEEGYDCVFGTRFSKASCVTSYPIIKLVLNRLVNTFIRFLFWIRCNDITNAFKMYRRTVVDGCKPLLSQHFNLTVELPLKAVVRGYSYAVIPINWTGRRCGESKLKLKEMGSRYLFIILYVWLEKVLSCGDYRKQHETSAEKKSK